jgi:hypothetical protein
VAKLVKPGKLKITFQFRKICTQVKQTNITFTISGSAENLLQSVCYRAGSGCSYKEHYKFVTIADEVAF